jgi:protein TonB
MKAYIASNIVYPWDDLQSGIEGKVYLDFVVEADGSVSTVTIKRGVSTAIDAEAKRVIESMPKWEPAHDPKHGDLKTRIRIPISFTIG